MLATDRIIAGLQASTAELDQARNQVGAALEHARQVRVHLTGLGFLGVAQGIAQVEDMLGRSINRLHGLTGHLRQAILPVQQITGKMSSDQVVERLTSSAERSNLVGTGLAAAGHELAQARNQVAAVLRGGEPGPLLARIDLARRTLIQVAQQMEAAKQDTATATAQARRAGASQTGN